MRKLKSLKKNNGNVNIDHLVKDLKVEIIAKSANETHFVQAVEEVVESLHPFFMRHPRYIEALPLICVPEQVHMFQVPWIDDDGLQRINNGFRVQFNQTIGPYKGGLRFHPSVNLSIIKFLGFEQTFKNALTGLPIGGGKGGSDFDPKGKSLKEINDFCKSFMTKLYPYIGPDRDVPAGDIGVGGREIGCMFGQYKQITNTFVGSLTGKTIGWGGSNLRPEATGYGLVYITDFYLQKTGQSIKNKRCLVSGSGNVAQFTAEKLLELGAKVMTFSDSDGTIYNKNGFTKEQVKALTILKNNRKRCSEMVLQFSELEYFENKSPWELEKESDIALPCATQNEIDEKLAQNLVACGVKGVFEGANMPSTNDAIKVFLNNKIVYIPGKAANAGGVAVSSLEMTQNSMRLVWDREKVDNMLKQIMRNIFIACDETSKELGLEGNYQAGANIAGFKRVADAMFQQGLVFTTEG